jgi:predicted SnoaL-like aldol condensation-catalyzing enzyme
MKTPLRAAMVCIVAVATAPTVGLAANTPAEAANKQLVLDYYRDIEATVGAGKVNELPKVDAKYRDPGYIQHSVGAGQRGRGEQGRAGGAPEGGPGPQSRGGAAPEGGPGAQGGGGAAPRMGPPKLLSIMAEGDLVNQVTMRSMTGPDGKPVDTIIFNLFRVKNGKLIEHWDAFGVPSSPTPGFSTPK